ncbi:hypothetical protein [Nocardia sp. Root136]|uniref:hypothetical protein n=1 Tax=Nocardia sp. Root136 TaxID=1736458 RepID=UPI000AE854B7|nr:hypothetical protein [Nocardia sp. Root136]
MAGRTDVGVRTFQLRLLSTFRRNDPIVDDALRKLGVGRDKMALAAEETGDLFKPSVWFESAPELLGPPPFLSTEPTGFAPPAPATMTRFGYELPLWPDYVFVYLASRDVILAFDGGFVRSADAPRATLNGIEDVRPWACVYDEVVERFGPPVEEGDSWPPFTEYKFQIDGSGGELEEYWLTFSWKLLQSVKRA